MIFPVGRFVLRLLAAIAAVFLLAFAALVWRLSEGPVSLGFLTPYLAEAMSYAEAGIAVEVEDTILTWRGDERTLDIQAINVSLRDQSGRVVASVPTVALGLNAPALLQGHIEPTRIDISDAVVRLVRQADGRVDFGVGTLGGADSPPDIDADNNFNIEKLLQQVAGQGRDAALAHLSRVTIERASVRFDDRVLNMVWQSPNSTLLLEREPGGVHGDLQLNVDVGGNVSHLSIAAHYLVADGTIPVQVAFQNIEPSTLAPLADSLKQLAAARIPVSGAVGFVFRTDGKWADLDFDVTGGPGQLVLDGLYNAPVNVTRVKARGKVTGAPDMIVLDEALIDLQGILFDAHGSVSFGDSRGLGLDIDGTLRNLSVERLHALWPQNVAHNARVWVDKNVQAGLVTDGTIHTHVRPGDLGNEAAPLDSLLLNFNFTGVQAAYYDPLTKITEGRVSAQLTTQVFDLKVTDARLGKLQLSDANVKITDLHKKDQYSDINLTVTGNSADLLGVLDEKPLGFISRLGLRPEAVGGTVNARAHFYFITESSLTADRIDVSATATLANASIPGLFDRFQLDNGALSLKVDKKQLDVSGAAAINGVPVNLTWRQAFDNKVPFPAQYHVSGTADDAGRARLGFPVDPFVTGPVSADLQISVGSDSRTIISGQFGLGDATMELDDIDWRKEKGVGGELKLETILVPRQPVRFSKIDLRAGDLKFLGSADLVQDTLQRARIDELSYGANQLSGTVERAADKGYDAVVKGDRIDLRPFLKHAFDPPPPDGGSRPLRIDANIRRAILDDATELNGLAAKLDRGPRGVRRLGAEGKFATGGTLTVNITPGSPRRQFKLTSDNAGAVLRYVGLEGIRGGTIVLDGDFADEKPEAPLIGQAKIEKFVLVRAVGLARVLTLASLSGIGALLAGEGISFERADVPLVFSGDLITLNNAHAFGPSIGITADGIVNRQSNTLNVNGTVVPANILNTVLGYIPLIGNIFVGRQGEGIFAVTYRINGSTDDPNVTVNPLSVLAPGILRRLFEFPDATPSTSPPGPETPLDKPEN